MNAHLWLWPLPSWISVNDHGYATVQRCFAGKFAFSQVFLSFLQYCKPSLLWIVPLLFFCLFVCLLVCLLIFFFLSSYITKFSFFSVPFAFISENTSVLGWVFFFFFFTFPYFIALFVLVLDHRFLPLLFFPTLLIGQINASVTTETGESTLRQERVHWDRREYTETGESTLRQVGESTLRQERVHWDRRVPWDRREYTETEESTLRQERVHWDRREYTETGESWEAGALVCLVVWSNQIPSNPPPVRKKWEDAVNCSSMESDDSSVGNDDSSVENGRAPWYLWSWTSKMEIILCGQVNVKHWSETWFSSPSI